VDSPCDLIIIPQTPPFVNRFFKKICNFPRIPAAPRRKFRVSGKKMRKALAETQKILYNRVLSE